MGKSLILLGVMLIVVGIIFSWFPKLFSWLGRLPGDISLQRDNFSLHFPLTTCLVISALISAIAWLFKK